MGNDCHLNFKTPSPMDFGSKVEPNSSLQKEEITLGLPQNLKAPAKQVARLATIFLILV